MSVYEYENSLPLYFLNIFSSFICVFVFIIIGQCVGQMILLNIFLQAGVCHIMSAGSHCGESANRIHSLYLFISGICHTGDYEFTLDLIICICLIPQGDM